jgi:ubiquinone/menaquinone biosynthesis C-methylase UbiE
MNSAPHADLPDAFARANRLFRALDGARPRDSDGILDLLAPAFAPTFTQRMLDTTLTAWLYDVVREPLMSLMGLPRFANEVRDAVERLALSPGDAVLDLACGHGNFTVELARRVGPAGLVLGVDISAAMLARAARRVRRAGLTNVLLVRADALALPFLDAAFSRVLCAGGLHQMPDLDAALREIARVSAPGGRFAASTFARAEDDGGGRSWLRARLGLHVVPVDRLRRALHAAGFEAAMPGMAGPLFAYASASRRSSESPC